MLELPLHAGTGHANLTWIVLSGLLSFVLGIGLGTYSDRFRSLLRTVTGNAEH
ncbi:MAG: hypothetical protein V5A36_08475 [Natronomonas sp.]